MSAIPKTAPTKREALRALLADGRWHHMSELQLVGGWRYGARLLEIRQEHGTTIEHRAIAGGDNEFEYRAIFEAQALLPLHAARPAAKQKIIARLNELARENEDLRRQLAEAKGATP